MKGLWKLICAGIFLLLVIWIVAISTRHRSVSFPVPDQNSYPDLLRAAALVSNTVLDYSKRESLERVVSESRDAYPIVISALGETCRVPIEVSQQWPAKHSDDVARLKRLTHAMIARAKLAELAGETETAFAAYTDAFRFADVIAEGGLALDFLNALSCRALVLQNCQSLLPSLTSDQRTEFLGLIQRSAAERETPAVVAKRTRQWVRETFGSRGRLEAGWRVVREAWQTRSWRPFASQRSILAAKESLYEQQYEKVVCDRLRAAD